MLWVEFLRVCMLVLDLPPANSSCVRHSSAARPGCICRRPSSAKMCTRKQNGMPTKTMWQKLPISKIQDGGRQPLWKSLNRSIPLRNRPILMKFGAQKQISIRLILHRSTLTLWESAAKVISTFLIFAVLVLRVNDCRPYTSFKTVIPFILFNVK